MRGPTSKAGEGRERGKEAMVVNGREGKEREGRLAVNHYRIVEENLVKYVPPDGFLAFRFYQIQFQTKLHTLPPRRLRHLAHHASPLFKTFRCLCCTTSSHKFSTSACNFAKAAGTDIQHSPHTYAVHSVVSKKVRHDLLAI